MNEHDLIKPSEEPAVRLVVFSAALLVIAAREQIVPGGPLDYIQPNALTEARAIADAVVAEAKRLSEQSQYVCTDCGAKADDTGKVQHKHGCSHEYIRG